MCAVSYLFTILSLPQEIKCFRTETIKPSKLQEESVFRKDALTAHCGPLWVSQHFKTVWTFCWDTYQRLKLFLPSL